MSSQEFLSVTKAPVKLDLPDFGEHFVGDKCEAINYLGYGAWVACAQDLRRWLTVNYVRELFERMRMFNQATHYLRNFILLGGTQREPLSVFNEPNEFRVSDYPGGTIVRLYQESRALGQLFLPSDYAQVLREDVYERFDSDVSPALGVVLGSVRDQNRKRMVCMVGSDKEISLGSPRDKWVIDEPINVGQYSHKVFLEPRINFPDPRLLPIQIDVFRRVTKVEILEPGKTVAARNPSKSGLHPALSLQPRHVE